MSKKGVRLEPDGSKCWLRICNKCMKSLKSDRPTPPKYAIANGFAIGIYPPELGVDTLTRGELLSCARAQATAYITLMRGGQNRALRSNVLAFGISTPLVNVLPVAPSVYYVIVSGTLTAEQRTAAHQRHRIDLRKVRRMLEWRVSNNQLYSISRLILKQKIFPSRCVNQLKKEPTYITTELLVWLNLSEMR